MVWVEKIACEAMSLRGITQLQMKIPIAQLG